MRGFGARDELALPVACWFCHAVGVCVCLGLSQCFWGSPDCAGDGFLRIIDLFYYKLKEIRENTMSIYSNQGCVFSQDDFIYEVICLNLYVCTATNFSNEERGFQYIGVGDVSSLTFKEIGGRIHPQARFSLPMCLNGKH